MTSRIEVVSDVSFQSPSQVPLSKHDHMVETFPANTSDKAFREWILPRSSGRREHLLDSHSLNPVSEMATVDSITVSYQISRCSIFRVDRTSKVMASSSDLSSELASATYASGSSIGPRSPLC